MKLEKALSGNRVQFCSIPTTQNLPILLYHARQGLALTSLAPGANILASGANSPRAGTVMLAPGNGQHF